MKTIYANILGNWTKLDKDVLINNKNAYIWLEENKINDFEFVTLYFPTANKTYYLSVSNLVYETISY